MYNEIIDFWFVELEPKQWWVKNEKFDQLINTRFGSLLRQAEQCELSSWRETALGSLAEVIVLDQFSRNTHRNDAKSFANDGMALSLAQFAISKGFDQDLSQQQCVFLYMPFMHSESRLIHQQAVKLYESLGIETNLNFELRHKEIVDRFGRYPHRNEILGRISTAEELNFLSEPGSSF
ncbi:MAG: DUF924 domain-containing protein [Acidiferrobacterales bacterium]|nr:DUF924 domain-containing protein [Acidiferrobacterales bacterium]